MQILSRSVQKSTIPLRKGPSQGLRKFKANLLNQTIENTYAIGTCPGHS